MAFRARLTFAGSFEFRSVTGLLDVDAASRWSDGVTSVDGVDGFSLFSIVLLGCGPLVMVGRGGEPPITGTFSRTGALPVGIGPGRVRIRLAKPCHHAFYGTILSPSPACSISDPTLYPWEEERQGEVRQDAHPGFQIQVPLLMT